MHGDDERRDLTIDAGPSPYIRAQLVEIEGNTQEPRALTNPLYLK